MAWYQRDMFKIIVVFTAFLLALGLFLKNEYDDAQHRLRLHEESSRSHHRTPPAEQIALNR